ncbi:MAG: response regulator transcription factor [Chloroflexi bacterium]|nr:response regulator transcription factor [Chloroflexota bacterium]
MARIRVFLVDDHEVVRMGLRAALEAESDLEVVGEAADGASALRQMEFQRPDVVLMDIRMPGQNGIEVCRAVRERQPDTRVIMLTSYGDEEAVFSSIMAGASGYLLKNTGRAELIRAIRSAAKGESLLDPSVTSRVLAKLRDLSGKEADREAALLSDREREVLVLVARGLTNKEIASQLFITENTARNHVSRILEKLGLSRRSEAATFAAQHGLLDRDLEERSGPSPARGEGGEAGT